MSNYIIRCIGFEQDQQASISAVLSLAERALSHTWYISDDTDGDVLMIHVQDMENVSQLLAKYQETPEYRIILVATEFLDSFQDHWFLEKKELGPPSLRGLVELLNQVGICLVEADVNKLKETQEDIQEEAPEEPQEELQEEVSEEPQEKLQEEVLEESQEEPQEKVEKEASTVDHSELLEVTKLVQAAPALLAEDIESSELDKEVGEKEFFTDIPELVVEATVQPAVNIEYEKLSNPQQNLNINHYFFGLLLQVREEKKYRVISYSGLPSIYFFPEEEGFYFSGTENEMLQYCLLATKKLNIKTLSRAKFNKALATNPMELERKDTISLISYAIITVSQGELLAGHSIEQLFILKEIPKIEDSMVLSRYKKIAKLMYQKEGCLLDIADQLQASLVDVFDFYNICFLLGYIDLLTEKKIASETENTKTLGRYLKSFFK